mmetsp:Transcript_38339/g.81475  ORF Transcript_38339/g.81475 Transcript_38339/m.81475 type:complete len:255 (-) Transcript_38339:251-1015(-)
MRLHTTRQCLQCVAGGTSVNKCSHLRSCDVCNNSAGPATSARVPANNKALSSTSAKTWPSSGEPPNTFKATLESRKMVVSTKSMIPISLEMGRTITTSSAEAAAILQAMRRSWSRGARTWIVLLPHNAKLCSRSMSREHCKSAVCDADAAASRRTEGSTLRRRSLNSAQAVAMASSALGIPCDPSAATAPPPGAADGNRVSHVRRHKQRLAASATPLQGWTANGHNTDQREPALPPKEGFSTESNAQHPSTKAS